MLCPVAGENGSALVGLGTERALGTAFRWGESGWAVVAVFQAVSTMDVLGAGGQAVARAGALHLSFPALPCPLPQGA